MKRFIAIAIMLVCLFAFTGCAPKQTDMGISADDFINGFNKIAKDNGMEQAAFPDYKQGVLPESGMIQYIFEKGTKITMVINKNLNVSMATIAAHPGLLTDDAALQEFKNTIFACINLLDPQEKEAIMQATGLNDLQNSMNKTQEDKGKTKLFFFDTNTIKKDPVHGKTYQLVYTDFQAKIYFDISYPLAS